MSFIDFKEDNFHISFELNEEQQIYISQFLLVGKSDVQGAFPLIQVHVSGHNQNDHHARKHTGSEPGSSLRYHAHRESENAQGKNWR